MPPRSETRQPPPRRGESETAPWEVLDVAPGGREDDGLSASHLDGPSAGMKAEEGPLRIVGWAVGACSPAREVEVVAEREVVGRTAVDVPRPRVAERFAAQPGAEAAGFDLRLEPSGTGISELLVQAVLDDGSRVPIALIRIDVLPRGALSRVFV